MRLLHDVEMTLTAEIGRTRLPVRQVLDLVPGTILELDRAAGAPADVMVNGRLVARGEVVVVDEDYGIRITEIVHRERPADGLLVLSSACASACRWPPCSDCCGGWPPHAASALVRRRAAHRRRRRPPELGRSAGVALVEVEGRRLLLGVTRPGRLAAHRARRETPDPAEDERVETRPARGRDLDMDDIDVSTSTTIPTAPHAVAPRRAAARTTSAPARCLRSTRGTDACGPHAPHPLEGSVLAPPRGARRWLRCRNGPSVVDCSADRSGVERSVARAIAGVASALAFALGLVVLLALALGGLPRARQRRLRRHRRRSDPAAPSRPASPRAVDPARRSRVGHQRHRRHAEQLDRRARSTITLLSVAPSLLLMMTAFTKIFVVLALTRNALGLQGVPPNQVLAGLALFLSPVRHGAGDQRDQRPRPCSPTCTAT